MFYEKFLVSFGSAIMFTYIMFRGFENMNGSNEWLAWISIVLISIAAMGLLTFLEKSI